MNEPLISIVVPAYNAEKTVAACLQSIIRSVGSAEGVEIVCVDDGSKDQTGALIDRIAGESPMVKPVHKQNGGASSARNAGLDAARGKYVMFCDADDEYCEGTVAHILEDIALHAPDYIVFKRETITLGGEVKQWSKRSSCQPLNMAWDEYLNRCLPYMGHTSVVFNKVYRREIIESGPIRFNTELLFKEDYLFNILFLEKASSLYEDTRAVYRQNKTANSLTTTGRPDFNEQNTKCLRLLQSDYPQLAEKIRPLITYSYLAGAELAVRRILSGRDVPPEGKTPAIRKILGSPTLRGLEKDFDYSQCEYLHQEMQLLLKGRITLFRLRFMALPALAMKLKR